MQESKSPVYLTAAERASRTGLTIRALRVYEQFGLISPTRTAGGWRQYGQHDIVRLHTINVLKAAGLSLLKISEIVRSRPNELPLKHVLRGQAQKPIPGSDATLRRFIDGVARDEPNYDEMTPALAYITRMQLPLLRALSSSLEPVLSMTFQGVGNHGWDVYDVERERGRERGSRRSPCFARPMSLRTGERAEQRGP